MCSEIHNEERYSELEHIVKQQLSCFEVGLKQSIESWIKTYDNKVASQVERCIEESKVQEKKLFDEQQQALALEKNELAVKTEALGLSLVSLLHSFRKIQ